VYVCSEADRRALAPRARAELCVLPNALPAPHTTPAPPPPHDGPFELLFVGTLGYEPNADAARFFCRQVLPLVRPAAPQGVRLSIVGAGAPPTLRALEEAPEVRLVGAVPDVAEWYDRADAVIAPIRAGGGTRIKVLEAFRARRPLVSTSIGVEGLEVRAEEHVLIGDSPAEFAAQCARLIAEPRLAEGLRERGFALFLARYTTEAVLTRVAAQCPPPPPRPAARSAAGWHAPR
jgi:glycosyltransferase involved in cell wall biosynthesis